MTSRPQRLHFELEAASEVMYSLSYLIRAVEDGGQASDFHLCYVRSGLIRLLKELGGFDELIDQHLSKWQ